MLIAAPQDMPRTSFNLCVLGATPPGPSVTQEGGSVNNISLGVRNALLS